MRLSRRHRSWLQQRQRSASKIQLGGARSLTRPMTSGLSTAGPVNFGSSAIKYASTSSEGRNTSPCELVKLFDCGPLRAGRHPRADSRRLSGLVGYVIGAPVRRVHIDHGVCARSPATAPLRHVAIVPEMIERKPNAVISRRRSGTMALSPPTRMPRDPKLAKPQSA